jgi:N-carbamoylputrescine amidase
LIYLRVMSDSLRVSLVRDVFWSKDGAEKLRQRLFESKSAGAELAVLPEIPLNSWCPATKEPSKEDEEQPGGPRHQELARAARESGIGLIGGVIARDPSSGVRHNVALVFSEKGDLVATYRKLHLPEEPGFWETSHYQPGSEPPQVVGAFGLPIGIQICSDINRPQGAQMLAAMGAAAIIVPRATEGSTFDRWRLVFRAVAMTTATYVISVTRPGPENGVPLGGPSIVVGPDGSVVAETTDAVTVVTLERAAIAKAHEEYPGYLAVRSDLYAEGWSRVARP